MAIKNLMSFSLLATLRSVIQSYGDLLLLALPVAIIIVRALFGWQLGPTAQEFINEHRYYLILTVVFGAMVGASEIMSRYRDEPFRAIFSPPGRVYMLLNGLISASAYLLLLKYRASVLPITFQIKKRLRPLALIARVPLVQTWEILEWR